MSRKGLKFSNGWHGLTGLLSWWHFAGIVTFSLLLGVYGPRSKPYESGGDAKNNKLHLSGCI